MKKTLPIIGIVILLVACAGFIKFNIQPNIGSSITPDPVVMTATSSDIHGWLGTSESVPAILGTSTTHRMTDPIQKDFNLGGDLIDQFCMNIYWSPSTTDAVLNMQYFTSQDGTNWYAVENFNSSDATTTADFQLESATSTDSWLIGSVNPRYRHYCPNQLRNLDTNYLRVEFSRSANLSGGKIFAEGWWTIDE